VEFEGVVVAGYKDWRDRGIFEKVFVRLSILKSDINETKPEENNPRVKFHDAGIKHLS
jgi:hypothetical protein